MIFILSKLWTDENYSMKNTQNPIRRFYFFEENLLNMIQNIWGLIGPKNVEILEFQKVEICIKNPDFSRMFPDFSCIF